MKSEIQNNDVKPELPFPKLMICNDGGFVVLMRAHKTGTVVHKAGVRDWCIGDGCTDWDMSAFTDFNGTITLSN